MKFLHLRDNNAKKLPMRTLLDQLIGDFFHSHHLFFIWGSDYPIQTIAAILWIVCFVLRFCFLIFTQLTQKCIYCVLKLILFHFQCMIPSQCFCIFLFPKSSILLRLVINFYMDAELRLGYEFFVARLAGKYLLVLLGCVDGLILSCEYPLHPWVKIVYQNIDEIWKGALILLDW